MAENIVAIVGKIGVGKSTLITKLEESQICHVEKETIEKIFRDLYYAEGKTFAHYFNSNTLSRRIAMHIKAKRGEGLWFLDTDMIWGRETYVQKDLEEGQLSVEDVEEYDRMIRRALDHDLGRTREQYSKWGPKLIVSLNAPPKFCYDRQNERKSKETDHYLGEMIPLEHFVGLDEYNKKFFDNIKEVYTKKWLLPCHPEVLHLDATKNLSTDPVSFDGAVKDIMSKLKEINSK